LARLVNLVSIAIFIALRDNAVYKHSTGCPMATKLTARQSEILALIQEAITRTGFPPTRAEIAQTLGFKSANAAEDHLRALEKKGVITLAPGASRGIRLTQASDLDGSNNVRSNGLLERAIHALTLPLVGRVAAGTPILATENIARELSVDPNLFSKQPDYLLEVRGMSMRDAGILDADLLAIKKAQEARSGQIVVARIGEEVTVKRLNVQKGKIRLDPENPDFEPIIVSDTDNFAIEGLVVGLIRSTPLH
jgi:repressor LexA